MPPRITLALLLAAATSPAQTYVVACASKDPGFIAAAETLRDHHKARLLHFSPDNLAPFHKKLTQLAPRHVAYVVEPIQLDFDLCRRLLQMATELDPDPFVDFAYGFFTGADAAETQGFVRRSIRFDRSQSEIRFGRITSGLNRSLKMRRKHRLRNSSLDQDTLMVAGKQAFPEAGHDRDFVRRELPGLRNCNLLMFIGHGMPKEVVDGPDFEDLAGLSFPGAVVLNVPCYNGTTHRYFERDYRAGTVHAKTIPLAESFALALLRTGVIGYTAYTCPRPAGPELDCDIQELVVSGQSLGTARRRDYDKTVLGFLGYGSERLKLPRIQDGARLPPVRDAVRDMMLEGATGGILFGDPALQPFAPRPGDALLRQQIEDQGERIQVSLDCPEHSSYLICSDPTARIGSTMAMRTYARIPLGTRFLRDVELISATIRGRKVEETRLIWALETDQGQNYAQVKVMLARPRFGGAIEVQLRLRTTETAALARNQGGTPIPEPQKTPQGQAPAAAGSGVDFNRTDISREMKAIQKRWGVGDEVLKEALALTRLAMTNREAEPLRAYKKHGAEGFRALCLLLELGHHHYRSDELLEATYIESEFERVFGMTARRPLPNWGDWTLLEFLGHLEADRVQPYLLRTLRGEADPGVFAHAALGLSWLGTAEAIPDIVQRLCANQPADRGVAHLLIDALGRLGGAAAKAGLRRYAAVDGAPHAKLARRTAAKL